MKNTYKDFRKLALGLMSVALVAVTLPTVGKATNLLLQESSSMSQQPRTNEFKIEEIRGVKILTCDSPNQSYFQGNYFSAAYGGSNLKCPMFDRYDPQSHTGNYYNPALMALLPEACNAHLPKSVCQLPSGQIKIFLTAPLFFSNCVNAYTPHFATDPNIPTGGGYNITRIGTVRLVDSDTKTVFLRKVGGRHADHSTIDPISSYDSIKFSQVHNKQVIVHDAFVGDQLKTVFSPEPIEVAGVVPDSSNSFWTCFEYEDNGVEQAIVGLHWFFDGNQDFEFFNMLDRMKKMGSMTQAVFLNEIQRLGDTDAFKNSGHIRKFLSLFSRQHYLFGTDIGNPFKLLNGFSGGEGTHRWTDGKKAVIEVPLQDMIDQKSRVISFIDTSAFVTPNRPQEVTVSLNGAQVKNYIYSHVQSRHTIDIAIPDGMDTARIEFDMPNAISPATLGLSDDPRELGISFKNIDLMHGYSLPRTHIYTLANDGGSPFDLQGFGGAEWTHRWTDGKKAMLAMPLDKAGAQRPKMISFKTDGYVTELHYQMVNVLLNGNAIGKYYYMDGRPKKTINIAIPEGDEAAVIEFEIPNAISPASLGLGIDSRELGIAFSGVEFTY
jgi:hypothetical protein